MSDYVFRLINRNEEVEAAEETRRQLLQRPCVQVDASLAGTAQYYRPSDALENAINTAIAVGDPLLLTGEAGTGKTQAAYYVAWKLGLEFLHFQVKSNTTANDLLYHFDTVRYFHDAHLTQLDDKQAGTELDKRQYVEKRPLWRAFEWAQQNGYPAVLLIDEIDKAPRDFPNDLLHEVDEMQFTVRETGDEVRCEPQLRPLVFITSNDERRLPPAFLRRCVSHHIELTDDLLREAVSSHVHLYPELDEAFLDLAIKCFWTIRRQAKEKPPATGELLVWLQVLSATTGRRPEVLNADLKDLPYLGTLIKSPEDHRELKRST